MAEASQKQLITTLKNLLVTGASSDFTVTCGPDTYKVHKNIVCSRAGFFARALRFGGKEAIENTVDLPEDDPAVIKLLFQWIYEGDYEPTADQAPADQEPVWPSTECEAKFPHRCCNGWGSCQTTVCTHHTCGTDCDRDCNSFTCRSCEPGAEASEEEKELLIHAKMYEIADKYDIPGLKDLVKVKFRLACKLSWNTLAFGNAAHYAFSTTPDDDKGLRDIVTDTIAAHMKALLKLPEIGALLIEFNGLAYDLLKTRVYPELQQHEARW
ncbi:uncharacterized protein J4E79_001657 [Alternaria viburni]|uniref:uncharacterized protein n=1 Tax=Alternaria viburni TaxID=566460 RepID=UPI0020C2C029|nr:uncharacterized protein J4E79_001657 [Alternaria viburni]KAI4666976.1 hypothetical protein J4E79_001657 [Alternaria viburni]